MSVRTAPLSQTRSLLTSRRDDVTDPLRKQTNSSCIWTPQPSDIITLALLNGPLYACVGQCPWLLLTGFKKICCSIVAVVVVAVVVNDTLVNIFCMLGMICFGSLC